MFHIVFIIIDNFFHFLEIVSHVFQYLFWCSFLFTPSKFSRLASLLEPSDLGVDVMELRIPIGMPRSLPRLAIRLQAVPTLVQEIRNETVTDVVTSSLGQAPYGFNVKLIVSLLAPKRLKRTGASR